MDVRVFNQEGRGSSWISDGSRGVGKGWAREECVLFCPAEDQKIIVRPG